MCFLLSNLFSALCQGKKAACRCWKQRQNSIQISVNPRGVAADSDNSLNVNHRGWLLSYCHMSSLDISPGAWRISFPKHVRHRTCFLNFSIIYWLYWIFTFFWGHISQYQLRRLSGVFSDPAWALVEKHRNTSLRQRRNTERGNSEISPSAAWSTTSTLCVEMYLSNKQTAAAVCGNSKKSNWQCTLDWIKSENNQPWTFLTHYNGFSLQ